jgi:alpha-galactosidase
MKTDSSLIAAAAVLSVALAAPAGQDEPLGKRLDNGLGRTPALGYNNWVSVDHAKESISSVC